MNETKVTIIGGGLAGSEAAWQLAQRGVKVHLYEMRPTKGTGAHQTGDLAELVCSNSFGTTIITKASGLLQAELDILGSLLISVAKKRSVPAGNSLSVDRRAFSNTVTEMITNHPKIMVLREEMTDIPNGPTLISSGPLTSNDLSIAISKMTGEKNLYFFDALAPIVTADSIDMSEAFRSDRYQKDQQEAGDYVNCPLTEEQYEEFITALLSAEKIKLRAFESEIREGVQAGQGKFFEGCLPVEVLAQRGQNALAYGPMRPVGLRDPKTGKRPYAVVQLRQDNLAGTLYNLVGFQTNLTYQEQKRVFKLIPALKNAKFVRFGQMHRNTFISSPALINPTMQFRESPNIFFAGQVAGVEGYAGNIASGLVAGINIFRYLLGEKLLHFPSTTLCGSLLHYICSKTATDFQPMKANFGLLPQPEKKIRNKTLRYEYYLNRSIEDLNNFIKINKLETL